MGYSVLCIFFLSQFIDWWIQKNYIADKIKLVNLATDFVDDNIYEDFVDDNIYEDKIAHVIVLDEK